MDELKLLKEDWDKKSDDFKDYSDTDIYGMIKHKSVSVMKTLLIIGLIEIVLWSVYGYIDSNFPYIRIGLFIVFFSLTIYLFNKMRIGENSIALMKDILNLRKVIFFYAGISFFLIVFDNVIHFRKYTKDFMAGMYDGWYGNSYHTTNPDPITPEFGNYLVYGIILIITMYILYWIYKRTYGKILFDLKKNYKELRKVE